MARIMSRCDMAACCKFGRRSNGAAEIILCCNARTAERAPLQAAQLHEALPVTQTTGARNWPIAHVAIALRRKLRRLRNEAYRSTTPSITRKLRNEESV